MSNASTLNPIKLQAENIDLQQRLEEAERRIHQLQVLATQQTVHVVNEHQHGNNNSVLDGLRNNAPERQIIENLRERLRQAEEKVSASMELVESLQEENTRLRSDAIEDISPPSSPPHPGSVSANPLQPLGGSDETVQQLTKDKEDLQKQLGTLRTQVATSNADIFRWKSAHTALNNELSKVRGEMQHLQSENRVATTAAASASSSQAHIDQIKALNEELNDRLQEKCDEVDSARAESEKRKTELAEAQAMLVRATQQVGKNAGSEKRLAALEAEVAKLKAELADERAENKSLEAELEQLRAQLASLRGELELEKKKHAEAEFDRILEGTDEEAKLRKVIQQMEIDLAKTQAVCDKAKSEHAIMLKLKDKTLMQLSQTSEELIKAREHFQKREQELLAQIAALQKQSQAQAAAAPQQQQPQPASPKPPPAAAEDPAVRQKQLEDAARQQQKLQADRDSQARDRRKAELMARLQERTREDKANAQVIFKKVSAAYDKLLLNLREAFKQDAGTSQEFCYYELLWDYERQLFHLRNDYESMQTIVGLKQGDSDAEINRVRNELENKLAILRFQLQDLGARPQC